MLTHGAQKCRAQQVADTMFPIPLFVLYLGVYQFNVSQ